MTQNASKAAILALGAAMFAPAIAGCSSGSDDPTGTGFSPESRSTSPVENAMADTSDVITGAGQTASLLGFAITQEEVPVGDGVTDGAGNALMQTGFGVMDTGTQLRRGMGELGENDNAVGTTLSGVPLLVAGGGKAVTAGSDAVPALAALPVFMQAEEASGVLTKVGNTLADAGAQITQTAQGMAVQLDDPNSALGGLTSQITVAIRPVVFQAEDGLQQAGDALVIGPAASGLLNQAGSAIVVAGEDIASQDIALLGAGSSVGGAGRLVQTTGTLLTTGEDESSGGLPTDALLASLGGGGLPTDDLLGGVTGGLSGGEGGALPTDQLLGGLTGDEEGGDNPVSGLLNGLTGALAQ